MKITVSVPKRADGKEVPKPVSFEKKVADLRGVVQKVNPVATSAVESRAPLVADREEAALTLKWHVGAGPGPRGFSNNLALAFSPDGKRLASATHDRTVKVWDVTPRSPDDMAIKKPP